MVSRKCVSLAVLVLSTALISATDDERRKLDPKFSYKYDLVTDLSVDSYQGSSSDGPQVTLKAAVALDPVGSTEDLWSLQLSSVKVEGNGKKTEIMEKSDPLFVQYSAKGTSFYLKDSSSHLHHTHSKETAYSNLLKSVAHLFQSHSGDSIEDHLGSCAVTSQEVDGQTVIIKTNCDADKDVNKHSNHPLGIAANVEREAVYQFDDEDVVQEIISRDLIEFHLTGNKETKSRIESKLQLKFLAKEEKSGGATTKREDLMKSLKKVDRSLFQFPPCDEDHCSKLKDFVEFRKEDYEKKNIGTDKLALSTLKTILDVQSPSEKDVEKIIGSKKVKSIRGQILDILGALQSWEAYSGAMTALMDKEDAVDDLERYLQTLAVGKKPERKIIEDILKRLSKDKFKSDKIKSTLILTVSSMAYNYAQTDNYDIDIVDSVDTYLWEHFLKCKELECSGRFLRGYLNMKLTNRIADLLVVVQKQHKILGTIAMKALQSFSYDSFSEKSQKALEAIFHQTVRRYDSSIRTLALDILMKGEMNEARVTDLLQALKQYDKSYEVKQYLLERFKLRAGECENFQRILSEVISRDAELNNYHRIATGGLTTALSRQFLSHPSFNSSIISVQEIQKGVLKRGIVDMFFTTEEDKFSYFTLELYARGMANMMGGGGGDDKEEEEPQEEETLTAGMELIVHGQSLRPLEFFNGQGELMGHVWSGTASDPTPAYQATTLYFDHRFAVPLQSGFVVQFDLMTAISINLSGQVSLSLWNRNGKSKVEQSIGLATIGRTTVVTDFSRTMSEFRLLQSPTLNLISNFEFSGDNLLCLQLSQPDITLKKTYWKKNAIPALKISDELEKSYSFDITGNSHLLNAKNNEMCRTIHNEL